MVSALGLNGVNERVRSRRSARRPGDIAGRRGYACGRAGKGSSMQLSFLRPLYDRPGPWCSVYLDASRDTQDARRSARPALAGPQGRTAGAGRRPGTVDGVDGWSAAHDPMPGDYGSPCSPPAAGWCSPSTSPRRRCGTWPRSGRCRTPCRWSPSAASRWPGCGCWPTVPARTRWRSAPAGCPAAPRSRAGERQLRRVQPGGWSQSRYQRAAMEAWHHNAGDAAAATAELAERVGADVVVVAGTSGPPA